MISPVRFTACNIAAYYTAVTHSPWYYLRNSSYIFWSILYSILYLFIRVSTGFFFFIETE